MTSCKCRITTEIVETGIGTYEEHHITYCPMHSVAPELVEALKLAKTALYNVPIVGGLYDQQHSDTHIRACLNVERAITRAEGRDIS